MKPYPSGPEPDEWPSLVPPGGRPPTAVGTATPEPPEKPSRNGYSERAPLVARIGSGFLGALFVGGSVALLTLPGLAPVLGAALGTIGIDVISRSVSGSGISMHWKGIRGASHRRQPRTRGRAA